MKTIALIGITSFLTLEVFSQDIRLTFTGTGAADNIDSIRATNLSTGQTLKFPGNETLVLVSGSGAQADPDNTEQTIVWPNPLPGKGVFTTYSIRSQMASLMIRNLSGRVVAGYQGFIDQGIQHFEISLRKPGIYSISFTTDTQAISKKMICLGAGPLENSIRHLNTTISNQLSYNSQSGLVRPAPKSYNPDYSLGFSAGDLIRFRCFSGKYITFMTDSPSGSFNYEIEFAECADGDGNCYPVVKIGDQTWMAENLAYLPKVDPSMGGSDEAPFLYIFDYQGSDVNDARKNEHFGTGGVLYNWPAAIIACPDGWHLPSDHEFDWLNNIPDPAILQSFSAIPAGVRLSNGNFSTPDHSARFWTSTDTDQTTARSLNLDVEHNLSNRQVEQKNSGYSVRCIRNGEASNSVPTVNTYPVKTITSFSAEGYGHLITNHAETASERGICWSVSPNPTRSDHTAYLGSGLGVFAVILEGLAAGTTYFYRAFATNPAGTGYGNELSFTTLEGGTFTDSRDSATYRYVRIGDQFWMAENLAWLPAVNKPSAISGADPRYYVYDYDGTLVSAAKAAANYSTYGVLYNWPAALTACPTGWHTPTIAEFTTLVDFLGGDSIAGFKMKSNSGWNPISGKNGNGDNSFGFTALPGGDLEGTDQFLNRGRYGIFWSTSIDGGSNGWWMLLDSFDNRGCLDGYPRSMGVSVRCIKD